jgi:catechol 2,3-dioxygenase-like lactoylglutathione lyase family enzyme
MGIVGLDHYAILSSDPERTTRFYAEIVGLTVGARPDLSFPGVWLYSGDEPLVHVIFDKQIPTKETGAVDHLAFKAAGNIDQITAILRSHAIEFSMRKIERTGVTQVFFRDPDNVGLELNFAPA